MILDNKLIKSLKSFSKLHTEYDVCSQDMRLSDRPIAQLQLRSIKVCKANSRLGAR